MLVPYGYVVPSFVSNAERRQFQQKRSFNLFLLELNRYESRSFTLPHWILTSPNTFELRAAVDSVMPLREKPTLS